jgi:hypothetical protein
MKDMHGKALGPGDCVLVYVQSYERERDASGVWAVDQSRPLPVADVPMARARIEWDDHLLALVLRYEWVCEAWQGKAGAMAGGGEYAFELLERAGVEAGA